MSNSRSARPRAPSYLHHRPSDQADTYVRERGKRRMIYLGPIDSAESHREFRKVVATYTIGEEVVGLSRRRWASEQTKSGDPTVADLCARFLLWSDKRHRNPDCRPSRNPGAHLHELDLDHDSVAETGCGFSRLSGAVFGDGRAAPRPRYEGGHRSRRSRHHGAQPVALVGGVGGRLAAAKAVRETWITSPCQPAGS
jgi:hypothetical protein